MFSLSSLYHGNRRLSQDRTCDLYHAHAYISCVHKLLLFIAVHSLFLSHYKGKVEYDGTDHVQVCPIYLSFLFTPSLHLVTAFILPFAPGLCLIHSLCSKQSCRLTQMLSLPAAQSLTQCITFSFLQEIQVEIYSRWSRYSGCNSSCSSPIPWSCNWKTFLTQRTPGLGLSRVGSKYFGQIL